MTKPGNHWIKGHHRRGKDWKDRLDAAREKEATAERHCTYVTAGGPRALVRFPCKRRAAPGSKFCRIHAGAETRFSFKPEDIALRELQTLRQRCGRCGKSWRTTAGEARQAWLDHQRECEAAVLR